MTERAPHLRSSTPSAPPPSGVASRARWALAATLLTALAGCSAIFGFDKEVFERGRDPGETEADGSVVNPPATDGAVDEDAPSPPVESRGIPDPAYGSGGVTVVDADLYWDSVNAGNLEEECSAAFDQGDRLVVACATRWYEDAVHTTTKFTRLDSSGKKEPAFGGAAGSDGGIVEQQGFVPFVAMRPDGTGFYAAGWDVAVDPLNSTWGNNLLVSFGADGAADTTFGSGGALRVAIPPEGTFDRIVGITTQGDKLVAATRITEASDSGSLVYSGSAWLEFDMTAKKYVRVVRGMARSPYQGSLASGIVRPAADRTVFVGEAQLDYYNTIPILQAFVGDAIDPSFGDAGEASELLPGTYKVGVSALLLPDGFLVLTSGAARGPAGAAMPAYAIKFDAKGVRDPKQGEGNTLDGGVRDGGLVTLPPAPFDPAPTLLVRTALRTSDGKVVVGGSYEFGSGLRQPFLTRVFENGLVDPSFGKDGWISPNFGDGAVSGTIWKILTDAQGRLLAVGTAATDPTRRRIFVMRYR